MKAAIRKPQLLAMVPMSESQITKLERQESSRSVLH